MANINRLEGLAELNKKITQLIKNIDKEEVSKIISPPAEMLKNDIQARAPISKKPHYKRGTRKLVPPGNLKRSVVVKNYTDYPMAVSLVGIDARIAPHFYLVEYGHAGPHPAPPHPFFRPAWDANKAQIEQEIIGGLIDTIEKAIE